MEQFNPGEKYRVLITSNSMDEHVVLDFTISTLSKSYSGGNVNNVFFFLGWK